MINFFPKDIPKATILLTIVSGPPGSGKTTSVKDKRNDDTLIIDFAEIKANVSGLPLYEAGDEYLEETINKRNEMLKSINDYKEAYFITNAAKYETRKYWADLLGAMQVKVYQAPPALCMKRIALDKTRGTRSLKFWEGLVNQWWSQHTIGPKELLIQFPR